MANHLIFWPMIGQVVLTIALYFILAYRKKTASAEGRVDQERRGLYDDAWPTDVIQVNNCIRNQFEVPILFYVVILMLWSLNGITIATHIFSWIFLISRIVHVYVHIGTNYVPLRRSAFTVGALLTALLSVNVIYILAIQ
ncbi:MAPEG family protein [Kordiimonas aquimaris]|uniref:MAPEG family protein n=1 Tax=Kordiimonas aquimaris TaxID=707591 RepID=UPI0021CF1AEC|nr:MAPEG family protein [Kordiimonas aquimaris]